MSEEDNALLNSFGPASISLHGEERAAAAASAAASARR